MYGIDSEYDQVNESMYTEDIEKIHALCATITCIYSDHDPYVPFEKEREFAEKVADTIEVIKGAGHINSESGYDTFEEIVKYL